MRYLGSEKREGLTRKWVNIKKTDDVKDVRTIEELWISSTGSIPRVGGRGMCTLTLCFDHVWWVAVISAIVKLTNEHHFPSGVPWVLN